MKELKQLFPEDRILTDVESLKIYGQDWTKYYIPKPLAVVFPKTTQEVLNLVQWARETKTPLVPSGGRTGLSGAAVAKNKEVIVSFEKMNRILGTNLIEQTITVEPGVITETLQNEVASKGFYFPIDFASRGSSHIGGNIATNAAGIKVIRYGLMRNWVVGLEVVTGSGEVLHLNNSLVKNASGYDLRHLMIGSEGTLGFITKATLKYTTPPKTLQVMLIGVNDLDSIMPIFEIFLQKCHLMAFELFTDKALKYVLKSNTSLISPLESPTAFYLLIEFEVYQDEDLEVALNTFQTCVDKGWVIDGVISQNQKQAKELWGFRENISESISPFSPYKNDISVSISNIPAFMKAVDQILSKEYPNIEVLWFGHIGDGNLHINILKPESLSKDIFFKNCQRVDSLLYTEIQSFRGSISAEHGVGLSKKSSLHFTRSLAEINIMKGIKAVFDPDGILNPGKIFDIS